MPTLTRAHGDALQSSPRSWGSPERKSPRKRPRLTSPSSPAVDSSGSQSTRLGVAGQSSTRDRDAGKRSNESDRRSITESEHSLTRPPRARGDPSQQSPRKVEASGSGTVSRTRRTGSEEVDALQIAPAQQPTKTVADTPKSSKASDKSKNSANSTREPRPAAESANKATDNQPPVSLLDANYTLSYILRPHSLPKEHENGDDEPDVWQCEFAPHSTTVMATCGGNTITVINTSNGRILKKYTHIEQNEELHCLAWTSISTLVQTGQKTENELIQQPILAFGGRIGSIKLMDTTQNEVYAYLFGHKEAISRLEFTKKSPELLLSASFDRTVRLWSIAMPEQGNEQSSCLMQFAIDRIAKPTAICLSPKEDELLVGCDTGLMMKFKIPSKTSGIISKAGTTYPVGEEWHESYVDDIKWMQRDDQHVISRATSDEEILVWNPKTSTTKDAQIRCSLNWPWGETSCLHFHLHEDANQAVLVTGNCEGRILFYNVHRSVKSRTLEDLSKELLEPEKVLSHPQSATVIRDVCVSANGQTIVAVNAQNMVYIWSVSE